MAKQGVPAVESIQGRAVFDPRTPAEQFALEDVIAAARMMDMNHIFTAWPHEGKWVQQPVLSVYRVDDPELLPKMQQLFQEHGVPMWVLACNWDEFGLD
jgi:hypothetical protein